MPDPLKAAGHFFVQTSEVPLEPIIITTRDFGGKTPDPVSLEFRAFFFRSLLCVIINHLTWRPGTSETGGNNMLNGVSLIHRIPLFTTLKGHPLG